MVSFPGMRASASMLGAVLAAGPSQAQERVDDPARLAIRALATARGFDGTVLIDWGEGRVVQESFGLAERAFGTPVDESTRFWIASITKTFTAVLVLQLCDEGRIDLDAPISAYLSDYAGEGADRVRVRNLLNHTSGIANWDTVGSYEEATRRGMPVYQLPHASDDLISEFASGPLVAEVGKVFDYNNADYVILGKIVEGVTGDSFEDALRLRILTPLGLSDTGLLRQSTVLPRLARTYFLVPGTGELVNDMPVYPENWYAAGGMYSTARDLATFADALYGGSLLPPETLRAMLTPGLDGYGYSVWVWEIEVDGRRHRTAERFGSIMGANGAVIRLLDDDVTIVILANTNGTDMRQFAIEIAGVALENRPAGAASSTGGLPASAVR